MSYLIRTILKYSQVLFFSSCQKHVLDELTAQLVILESNSANELLDKQ